MKVTFLNTFENYGGAGYAALRIFEAMKQHTSGEYSFFPLYRGSFNRYHPANFPGLIRIGLEKARLRKQIKNPGDLFKFETGELGGKVAGRGTITRSDLLHLHWVNQGFLSIPTLVKLARLKPLVWTLHDMWAFTGGCSHSYDCERYRESCGQCPYLRSGRKDDLSNRIWHRKQEIYNTGKIALVGPSRWITQRAGQSSLGMLAEIVHIPNPLDTELFSPGDKLKARQALSIDPDKTVLIFGAQNIERKGFDHLEAALQSLAQQDRDAASRLALIVFGSSDRPGRFNGFPVKVIYKGLIKNASVLKSLYQASDWYIHCASIDNLPNTMIESIACGVPVIGFNSGGIREIITEGFNGFLTSAGDTGGLVTHMRNALQNPEWRITMGAHAREFAIKNFSMQNVAEEYYRLYQRMLTQS